MEDPFKRYMLSMFLHIDATILKHSCPLGLSNFCTFEDKLNIFNTNKMFLTIFINLKNIEFEI